MQKACIGIIFNADGKEVLLIKRRDVPIWVLPGGGIDIDETPEQAIIREMKEETGLDVVIKRKVSEYIPTNKFTGYTHFFECEIIGGNLTTGEETKDLNFFPIEKFPKPLFFLHEIWIKEAQLNLPYLIKREIQEVNLLQFLKYFLRHPIQVIRFILSRLGLAINN